MIKQLNAENGSTITTGMVMMVHTSSFPSYKYHIKNEVIHSYISAVFSATLTNVMFVENIIAYHP